LEASIDFGGRPYGKSATPFDVYRSLDAGSPRLSLLGYDPCMLP
jgi:hypothetical protein